MNILKRYFNESLWTKYFDFSGRATRSEYWFFQLISILLLIILISILASISSLEEYIVTTVMIYFIITFIPSFSISFRRLHDTGRSGWWILISFIPLIGPIIMLFFLITDSQLGTNKYGPNPKGMEACNNCNKEEKKK
jgi:uncharacterized membrane protein YhaH (DUF805 family)